MIPAAMGMKLQMRHAEGIDHGHDHNLGVELAFVFRSRQHRQEVMEDKHARLFVSMQPCLHENLWPCAVVAKPIELQGSGRARGIAGDRNGDQFHRSAYLIKLNLSRIRAFWLEGR